MGTVYLVVLLLLVIGVLACFGKQRAAYTVLRMADHLFEGENDTVGGKVRKRDASARNAARPPRAHLTPYLKKQIAYDQGWKCSCGCGALLQADFHIDHTVPLWQGGLDTTENMTAMNSHCHARKTAIENQRA